MTIDQHGRAHHAAGSPASIGGQYAQQPAPAAAAALRAPTFTERDIELRTAEVKRIEDEIEMLEASRAEANARVIEARMSVAGVDRIDFGLNDEGFARGTDLLDGMLDLEMLSEVDWDDWTEQTRFITRESIAEHIGVPRPAPKSLADAARRTSVAYEAIRGRFYEVESDSVLGIAHAVRERFPDAAAISVDLDDERETYIPRSLLDANGEPIHEDDFLEWVSEAEESDDGHWRDALQNIREAHIVVNGDHSETITFAMYETPEEQA